MNIKTSLKTTALTAALSAALVAPSVHALGMVAGATEPTQIMNNYQLVVAHIQQVQEYAKQVQQYANQIKRWKLQIDALKQIDPGKVRDLLKGVRMGKDLAASLSAQYDAAKEMAERMDGLTDHLDVLAKEGKVAADVMWDLKAAGHDITGQQYIEAMQELAKNREDEYGERIRRVRASSAAALDEIQRINKIAEMNPELVSHMDGLQAIVGTNNVIAGQLAYLNQTQTEATVEQMKLNRELIREIDQAKIKERQVEELAKGLFAPISNDPPTQGEPH